MATNSHTNLKKSREEEKENIFFLPWFTPDLAEKEQMDYWLYSILQEIYIL